MVGEFPELQGHMGRAYALAQGETREVADAIRDHYKPLGAQDDVAPDDVSAIIALADRFDTLAGCFAVGLAPTGAADPFALRRACIGALRTMLDRGYGASPSPRWWASRTTASRARSSTSSRAETVAKLEEFAIERLRGLLASATSSPSPTPCSRGDRPGRAAERRRDAWPAPARCKAVVDAKEPWLDKARIVAKRLAGHQPRGATPSCTPRPRSQGSAKKDDAAIQKLVRELDATTEKLSATEQGRAGRRS